MVLVKRFEEFDAWKKARCLTKEIYATSSRGKLAKDFGLRDQIQRAAVSMMSNIAEGHGYLSNKQFIHFLNIARASGAEVQSLLYVMLDADYIMEDEFSRLYKITEQTISLTAGLQRYLRNQPWPPKTPSPITPILQLHTFQEFAHNLVVADSVMPVVWFAEEGAQFVFADRKFRQVHDFLDVSCLQVQSDLQFHENHVVG